MGYLSGESITQDLRIIENQSYRTNLDGALKLDLILPEKQKLNALIIVIHGGGWKKARRNLIDHMDVGLLSRGMQLL